MLKPPPRPVICFLLFSQTSQSPFAQTPPLRVAVFSSPQATPPPQKFSKCHFFCLHASSPSPLAPIVAKPLISSPRNPPFFLRLFFHKIVLLYQLMRIVFSPPQELLLHVTRSTLCSTVGFPQLMHPQHGLPPPFLSLWPPEDLLFPLNLFRTSRRAHTVEENQLLSPLSPLFPTFFAPFLAFLLKSTFVILLMGSRPVPFFFPLNFWQFRASRVLSKDVFPRLSLFPQFFFLS